MWHYDPRHLISKQRVELKSSPYVHHINPRDGILANKYSWEEVQSLMCMQYSSRDAKPQTMKSISVGLVDIEDINPKSSGEK